MDEVLRTLDSDSRSRLLSVPRKAWSRSRRSRLKKNPQNIVVLRLLIHDDRMVTPEVASSGVQLGYARVSTSHQSLDQQLDALSQAGVDADRVYSDRLSGVSTRELRPGLSALLDYARPGDAIVVVGIDRLGRNAAEVMTTIRELGSRNVVLRSLREGIDTSNAAGRMIAGVLASLAELELELGRERRTAAREAPRSRGQPIGRPKALDNAKAALVRRMHASGEPVSTIAGTLGVSRATVYRALADEGTGE